MPVGMYPKRSDVGVPPSPRIAEDLRTTRNRTGILGTAGFRRRVPHHGSRSLRTAELGFRRIVRRPFNVPWPGPVDRHVPLGRCSFKNLPARRRHRCDHVACPRVSDHDGTVPRRPTQRNATSRQTAASRRSWSLFVGAASPAASPAQRDSGARRNESAWRWTVDATNLQSESENFLFGL